MKTAAKFSRENPCTKVELHNGFFSSEEGRYVRTPTVSFKQIAGDNSVKYLVREGYATQECPFGIDYLQLTEEGEDWLTKGLARYLELHPERSGEVNRRKVPAGATRTIRRGVSSPQEAAKQAPGRSILRRSGLR